MFDMFKGMGQLAGLMRNLPKLQEEMAGMQERLAQVSAEGDAGAGMVKVRVNGKFEMLSCTIHEDALKDREMLQDLVKAAANQALAKARDAIQEESSKLAAGLGMPPGFKLPGM